MKFRIKILPILLSILLFNFSIFQCDLIVYASAADLAAHLPNWNELSEFDKWVMIVEMCGVNLRAFWKGDYEAILNNIKAVSDFAEGDPLESGAVTVTDEGIVFSEDLVSAIKQALKEYAEESCGFWIMPTVDFRLLSGADFNTNYVYQSLKNIVNEKEIVVYGARGNGVANYLLIPDIYNDIPMVYICTSSSYDPSALSNSVGCPTAFYGADTWTLCTFKNYYKNPSVVYTTYDEFKEDSSKPTSTSELNISSFYTNLTAPFNGLYVTSSRYMLISKDGRRVKVYKSLDAYKYASTNTRPIYFGSGFYESSGEVKVSFDDLQDYLDGKYDSFFDDLKNLLPDNDASLSEDEIEKIVDKLLGQLGEVGDKVDSVDGSLKETNSILENIASALSGYFESMTSTISGYLDAVLMYLESILTDLDYIVLELQDMTEEEIDTKSDSVISELSGAFSEIGDMMSQKFPFSIPWDIKNLYVALSGGKEPGIQTLSDDLGITDLYHDSSPPTALNGRLIDVVVYSSPSSASDGIMPLVADEDMENITPVPPSGDASFSESGAPVFKIPFVIQSAGVNAAVLIDMSYFDIVSEFSRTMFLLVFLHQLFLLSMRVFEFVRSFMG